MSAHVDPGAPPPASALDPGAPPPASMPPPPPSSGAVPSHGPSAAAGGTRLVAAMEHVDRVVAAFLEDIGRAVASVRAEVASERDASIQAVDQAREHVAHAARQLAIDREDFERHRERQEADLERRWTELRQEQERDKLERTRAEREIRELSHRATAETQAAALVQMQAAQAAQAASFGIGIPAGGGPGIGIPPPGPFDAPPGMMPLANGMVGFPPGAGPPGTDHARAETLDPYPYGAVPPTVGYAETTGAGRASSSSRAGDPPSNNPRLSGAGPPGPPGSAAAHAGSEASSGPELVFAVGGLHRANAPLWTAEVFEAREGAWRVLPEMSTARGYLGVAHAPSPNGGTSLLAIGGSDGASTLATCEAFNYGANAWRSVASMSRPRIWLSAASCQDAIFAVGGYDGAEYLDLVEAYRPGNAHHRDHAGRWTTCKPLSSGRSTMGLCGLNGTLYAAGGFAAPRYLATAEAYDPGANQWWGVAPMASPRRDLGMCALEARGLVVALGGYDGERYLGSVEALDPRTNRWRALAPMRRPRQLLAACARGDEAFAVGGFDGRETVRTVEVYDARADRWRDGAPMSTARLGLGACCA